MTCHPGSVGGDQNSFLALSPAPPPNLGVCGLSNDKLSVCQAAHFSPSHTGDHVPVSSLSMWSEENSRHWGMVGFPGFFHASLRGRPPSSF